MKIIIKLFSVIFLCCSRVKLLLEEKFLKKKPHTYSQILIYRQLRDFISVHMWACVCVGFFFKLNFFTFSNLCVAYLEKINYTHLHIFYILNLVKIVFDFYNLGLIALELFQQA